MNVRKPHSINVGGRLMDLSVPRVMGIVNLTPDSFYAPSRTPTEADAARRARQLLDEGADLLDVGAYSSRPGAADVSPGEEMERLRRGLRAIRQACPEAVLSVDTFRSDVARMCVEELGVSLVNDISGGALDPQMLATVARLGVPYILMHMQGTPHDMQAAPRYVDVVREVFLYLSERVQRLRDLGVGDIILDPGFGFGKTLAHNYELLSCLEEMQMFDLPILVGVSRKSMVYRLLGVTPQEALTGTTVLHTIALLKGAHILRVHDVRPAVEAVRIVRALEQPATVAPSATAVSPSH